MNSGGDRKLWVVLASGVAGLALVAVWQGQKLNGTGPRVDPRAAQEVGIGGVGGSTSGALSGLGEFGVVPDFRLVSQTGDSVRLANLAGQVWIGDFIFTNCKSSCPMMSAQLQRLGEALAGTSGVRLVSFSVDPERDTPGKLAEYAKGYGATPERWLFLTGDKLQVRRLSTEGFHLEASDVSPAEAAQGVEAVMHSTRLVLVDGRAHIRGYYDGTDDKAMEDLNHDIRRLLGS